MIAQPLFQRQPTALPGYQRPPDWLPIPDMSSTEGFCGLHAVWNDDANFCAFTCQGAYTVDWGDGTTPEDFASGATAYHNFAWADYDASTLTSRGYRQALVTVTPQSGASLTSISLAVKHNQSGLAANYATGWLDLELYGPNLTALSVSGGGNWGRHSLLEKCTIHSIGSVTNMTNMFYSCTSLQSVPLFDSSSVTNMTNMFYSCISLQSVPLFDTSSATNMTNMFNLCNSLSRVEATGIKVSVSFAKCKLSSADLNEIYTNLATVTGQTITVTGNYGVTSDNPSIATAKGWTVTG